MKSFTPVELQQIARFALDRADEGAFWTDLSGQLLYANATAGRLLGYTAEEMQSLSLFQTSPDLTPELWAQLWKEIKARQSFAFEFSLQAKDGHTVAVEM